MKKLHLPLFLLLFNSLTGLGQKMVILRSNTDNVSIRDGDNFRQDAWHIDASVKPDIYECLVRDKSKTVVFKSGIDSVRFVVQAGKTYRFIILLNNGDSAYTQINGIKDIPPARFNTQYIKQHDGKTYVEIPKVYELLNIVFALTEKGRKEDGLIIKTTSYYQDLIQYFDRYKREPVVLAVDSILKQDDGKYFSMKMDAYAFEFSASGKITQSAVYDRISWGRTNTLRPWLKELQAFSDKSGFQKFYDRHQRFYAKQITVYRDSLGVPEMQKWLTKNFPTAKYNSFKIIFSPLVGYNQSANWFEDNGFKEAQAHVNFPYRDEEDKKMYSQKALNIRDGNIVFTELNHAFINPEGEKLPYQPFIERAFENLDTWNEMGKPAGQSYNDAYLSFNEYMNWALVSLRYVDDAPAGEQDKLIAAVEKMMVERRGFKKFDKFNQYLVNLYKHRKEQETVADLYPEIVKWFDDNK